MDATCTIQDSIHVFNLVHKYVSRILGTYHFQHAGHFLYLTNVSSLKKLPSPADLRYDLLLHKPSA